jgi:hypothetical protein
MAPNLPPPAPFPPSPPPGNPPWASSPPPYLGSPGPGSDGTVWVLAAVLGVALIVFLGSFLVFQDPSLPGNCTDWYVSCPGGPGDTPLGTAFQFGNTSSMTVPAGAAPQPGCRVPSAGLEYCGAISIEAASEGVATNVIGFELLNGNDASVPYESVTLLDAEGNGIAFVTPGGSWTLCTPSACGSASSTVVASLPAVLATDEELVLDAGPSAQFPSGLTTSGLEAFGTGSFAGTVGPVGFP